ncbi:uvrD_C_2 domain-containing protein [Trichonephila inaurata madagascariensis]|uniref:UvrD_C_2 domain-containing protein n=1 Tax=Trichonephila inaurata madagascariensis TaxID=2747483 RepID=A0A8X6M9H5_9ARAC|nr:uvrD_C_2 domain-containing protein [Trichonephila inaurata madagascariensis]
MSLPTSSEKELHPSEVGRIIYERKQELYKMRADNTGKLPYELILVLNRPCMITNNIDVADGLSNGPVGKLCYVERDENHEIIRIWMKFPKLCGRKRATKSIEES